jgi:uncharacterized cupin superfamily protein
MTEAKLEQTDAGVVPAGEGWFVLNARETVWADSPLGFFCDWEGEGRLFPQLGINVSVLNRGQCLGRYHLEPGHQEDFLVLGGRCVAIVDEQEREMGAWDLLHCPPGVAHMIVGAGEEPAVVISVGTRGDGSGVERGVTFPASDVARRYGVSVERETSEPAEAYADVEAPKPIPYGGWLDA